MRQYRVSYYYLATGMEGKADSYPEKIITAGNREEAIYAYLKSVGITWKNFKAYMREEKYVREWGVSCELI